MTFFTANTSRLIPYWVTVVCALWILFWLYAWTAPTFYPILEKNIVDPVGNSMCTSLGQTSLLIVPESYTFLWAVVVDVGALSSSQKRFLSV